MSYYHSLGVCSVISVQVVSYLDLVCNALVSLPGPSFCVGALWSCLWKICLGKGGSLSQDLSSDNLLIFWSLALCMSVLLSLDNVSASFSFSVHLPNAHTISSFSPSLSFMIHVLTSHNINLHLF